MHVDIKCPPQKILYLILICSQAVFLTNYAKAMKIPFNMYTQPACYEISLINT